eukprot:1635692-Ditylum_brightwellii.AAC.1
MSEIWHERNAQVKAITSEDNEYKVALLNLAILDELDQGIEGLPHFYCPYFKAPTPIILSKSLFF